MPLANAAGTEQTALQGFEWRFWNGVVNERIGLNEPPDRIERSVLTRDKVRHEAFPTGLPCSVM